METKTLDNVIVFNAIEGRDAEQALRVVELSLGSYDPGGRYLVGRVIADVIGIKLPNNYTEENAPKIDHRRNFVDTYSQQMGLEGYCVLMAHGGHRIRKPASLKALMPRPDKDKLFEPVYWDNGLYSLQEWVDLQDGKYAALFLDVCNPLDLEIRSKSSLLFVPDNSYSVLLHGAGVNMVMYVPGNGRYNDIPQRKIGLRQIVMETLNAI